MSDLKKKIIVILLSSLWFKFFFFNFNLSVMELTQGLMHKVAGNT